MKMGDLIWRLFVNKGDLVQWKEHLSAIYGDEIGIVMEVPTNLRTKKQLRCKVYWNYRQCFQWVWPSDLEAMRE